MVARRLSLAIATAPVSTSARCFPKESSKIPKFGVVRNVRTLRISRSSTRGERVAMGHSEMVDIWHAGQTYLSRLAEKIPLDRLPKIVAEVETNETRFGDRFDRRLNEN
ncbi:hypothetical protein QLX08_010533 [Tetragonisca angustula]|uniref:Uncharacterized protein n=1 Tax=Tetragonisca angustula TaxID=166442 RepID=A0AAW0ZC05_9HYME